MKPLTAAPPQDAAPRPGRRPPWVGWGAAFAVATLLAVAFPTAQYATWVLGGRMAAEAGVPVPPTPAWTRLVLMELPVWYSWLLVSPAILALSRRFPLTGERRLRNAGVHLLGAMAAVVAVVAMTQWAQNQLRTDPRPVAATYGQQLLLSVVNHAPYFFTLYLGIVAVQHAVLYFRAYQGRALQAAQLESRLAQAQLDVLRMQLQPHFLFNTLNTISALILKEPSAALAMVGRLGELLRRSLDSAAVHEVPLREELAFLEQYVSIQRIRFGDRLTVDYTIDEGALDVLVPRLILQPLVENAIRHGIQQQEGAGRIQVRAAESAGGLALEVADDGPGLSAPDAGEPGTGAGIGLQNTRARLEQLYGAEHAFELARLEPGLAVRIRLPARRAGAGRAAGVAEFVETRETAG